MNTTGTMVAPSLDEYLLRRRGPKHLPLTVVVPITVVYSVILTAGVIGNLAVCLVIAKNSAMHTATNYYLFSLAVSDLTLLILGLPNDLSVYWQQYPWALGVELCKFRALVSEMSSYTSVLTIVAFSMERYLAICHPLHSYTMSGLDRAIKIVGLLWFISFLSALPFAIFTTVNYIDFPPDSGIPVPESAFCAMLDENIPPHWPLYELSSFLFFFIPLLIIIVLYVRIGVRIDDRSRNSLGRQVEGAVHGETRHSQSRKSIIRMLSAVVIAFFLCWAPFHAQRLMYLYARNSPHYETINEWMYYITGCFYYFSSTINPILYNLMSIKYRLAFKQTLCGGNATIPRELNSSFRETYVCVNGELRKSHRGTKNQSSNNQNTPSELVVTAAQSSSIKKSYGSRTRTKQWPKTLLRVTIRPSLESTEIESEANEIQSVQTIPKQNCEPPSGFIEQVQIETSI